MVPAPPRLLAENNSFAGCRARLLQSAQAVKSRATDDGQQAQLNAGMACFVAPPRSITVVYTVIARPAVASLRFECRGTMFPTGGTVDDLKQLFFAPEAVEMFWRTIERGEPDDCWPCTHVPTGAGHCMIRFAGRQIGAHRTALLLGAGALPVGKLACQSCHTPRCCNPRHLYAGTCAQNAADRERRRRERSEPARQAWLTRDQVRAIRARVARGGVRVPTLAREYGVAPSAIRDILQGKTWVGVK